MERPNQYLAEAEAALAKTRAAAAKAAAAARDAEAEANKVARRIPLPPPVKIVTGAPPARGVARKLTLERQREYLDAIARGTGRNDAAKLIGVSRQAIKNLRDRDPDFKSAEDEAESMACDLVEEALFSAALAGNVDAQKTWLFNRAPGRWQPTQKLQVQVSGQIDMVDVEGARAEIQALEAALRARVFRNAETPALEAGVLDAEVLDD